MKRFAGALAVTLGLVVLSSFVLLVPHKNATATGSAPVTVVNTPLPVTGSVGITGSVAVSNPALTGASVPVSGTVNANVTFPSSLAATLPTHLGVPLANLITLACSGFSGGICTSFFRVKTDATFEAFSLQQGQGLVITDIQMAATGVTPGQLSGFAVGPLNGPTCFANASSIYNVFVVADQTGEVSINDHITGGLHFTTLPCFEAPAGLTNLTLVGYLVQE